MTAGQCWIQEGQMVEVLSILGYLAETNSHNESEPTC